MPSSSHVNSLLATTCVGATLPTASVTPLFCVAGAIPPQLRELYSSHGLSQMSQISQMSQMSQMSPARLLELNRYSMRPYDLAQQMISQQTAVTKLLSKFSDAPARFLSRNSHCYLDCTRVASCARFFSCVMSVCPWQLDHRLKSFRPSHNRLFLCFPRYV